MSNVHKLPPFLLYAFRLMRCFSPNGLNELMCILVIYVFDPNDC